MRYAVLLCLLAACHRPCSTPLRGASQGKPRVVAPKPTLDVQAQVARVRERARAADVFKVLDLVYARLDDHFAKRLAHVDRVSAELFSAKWKWRATFWSDDEYTRAVRRLFDKEFFDGIPALVEAISRDIAAAAEASDNRLMAEVADIVRSAAPTLDVGALQADYRVQLTSMVRGDLEMNLVSIAASDFVASLVTGALAASGLFGPAVAAGAATSWWNLGVGMVVAVVVAVVVDSVVGDAYESEARTKIWAQLSKFRMDAIKRVGDAASSALRRYVKSREEAVAKAAEKSLEPFTR